jgi:hypothetical protein
MTDVESWRPIPGLEQYSVSSFGRVKGPMGKIRKLKACSRGYLWLSIADGKGSSKNISVARSVCSAFNGGNGVGMDCDHINRIRDENIPKNLRWVSRSKNLDNRVVRSGQNHHASKLSEELVSEIRSSSHFRGFDRQMADRVGVSRETIRDVRLGKIWRNVNAG